MARVQLVHRGPEPAGVLSLLHEGLEVYLLAVLAASGQDREPARGRIELARGLVPAEVAGVFAGA